MRATAVKAREGWERLSRPGDKLRAQWRHVSGWEVFHCGHPTANHPYYASNVGSGASKSEMLLTSGIGIGIGLPNLLEAMIAVELWLQPAGSVRTWYEHKFGRGLASSRESTIPTAWLSSGPPAKVVVQIPERDPRLPRVGTILEKRRKGHRVARVTVLASGFLHRARVYPSLSAVANAIAGGSNNGFLFFGLIDRKKVRR